MRINEVFGHLHEAEISPEVRNKIQNLLRKIIVGRGKLALCNDIVSLYLKRDDVAKHFKVDVSDLDVLWTLPRVRTVLETAFEGSSADDDDEDYEGGDDEGQSDGESEEVGVGSRVDAALERVFGLILILRRDIYVIACLALLVHGAIAIGMSSESVHTGPVRSFSQSVMGLVRASVNHGFTHTCGVIGMMRTSVTHGFTHTCGVIHRMMRG